MKPLTLPLAILVTLCLGGCERDRDPDRPFVDDAAEPSDNAAFGDRNQAEHSSNARSREIAEQGDRNPAAGGVDAPAGIGSPKADPSPHDELDALDSAPTDPGTRADQGPQTRAEFVAASRRRLEQMERELQQLEGCSRERGKELRAEIREEKRRLDTELERMDRESEEAWSQMKEGFADALGRLEVQIRKVREDIDPAS